MKSTTYTFDVWNSGEAAAGISPYSEEVRINLESGNPGGDPGEFEEFMAGCLAEWFDGAIVELRKKKEGQG